MVDLVVLIEYSLVNSSGVILQMVDGCFIGCGGIWEEVIMCRFVSSDVILKMAICNLL